MTDYTPVTEDWFDSLDADETTFTRESLAAHARTDVPALVAALEAVLAVHQPGDWSDDEAEYTSCRHCGEAALYPCPTVEAINEALGGSVGSTLDIYDCQVCGEESMKHAHTNRPWIGVAASVLAGATIGVIAGVGVGVGILWVITGVGR